MREHKNTPRKLRYGCGDCQQPAHFTTLSGNRIIEPNAAGEILWHICNFTPDQKKYKTLFAIEQAFKVWQPHFFPIEIKPTSDFDAAHIKIFFVKGNHSDTKIRIEDGRLIDVDCSYPFDGAGGVLAHAFAPYGGHLAGHLHLDEAENWADMHKPGLAVDLLTVMIHEIGHNWNLGHSKIPAAIMFPTYNGIKHTVDADDIEGVNHLYGEKKREIAERLGLPTANVPAGTPPAGSRNTAREFMFALIIFLIVFVLVYLGNQ